MSLIVPNSSGDRDAIVEAGIVDRFGTDGIDKRHMIADDRSGSCEKTPRNAAGIGYLQTILRLCESEVGERNRADGYGGFAPEPGDIRSCDSRRVGKREGSCRSRSGRIGAMDNIPILNVLRVPLWYASHWGSANSRLYHGEFVVSIRNQGWQASSLKDACRAQPDASRPYMSPFLGFDVGVGFRTTVLGMGIAIIPTVIRTGGGGGLMRSRTTRSASTRRAFS